MRDAESGLTQERLKQLLHYDPETGVFTRKTANSRWRVGSVAGTVDRKGYRQISINEKKYAAHRLAWFYVHGVWPPDDIDHKNRRTDDNRIANLRPATRSQNNANMRRHRDNAVGLKGVSWSKSVKKWQAQFRFRKENYHLGYFGSPEAAHAAYLAKSRDACGEFARAG